MWPWPPVRRSTWGCPPEGLFVEHLHPLGFVALRAVLVLPWSLLLTWPLAYWLLWYQSSLEEMPLSNFLSHSPGPSIHESPPRLIKQASTQVLFDLVKRQRSPLSGKSQGRDVMTNLQLSLFECLLSAWYL